MSAVRDLSNQRFGRLWAIRRAGYPQDSRARFVCKCDCGNQCVVRSATLCNGKTRSCGCLMKETRALNGFKRHHLWANKSEGAYRSWRAMRERCRNRVRHNAGRYYFAGIAVCDRWKQSFDAFLFDMGDRPNGTTLDRIDGTKGYEPSNCRWATPTQQSRNRVTGNRQIAIMGETRLLVEWFEKYKLHRATFYNRLKHGWAIEDAICIPVRKKQASS